MKRPCRQVLSQIRAKAITLSAVDDLKALRSSTDLSPLLLGDKA